MPPTQPLQPQTYNGDFAEPPQALAPLCLMPHWVLWKWQLNKKGDWANRRTNPAIQNSTPKKQ
jgi:hypothetical protein